MCALDDDRVGGWSNSDPVADEPEDGEGGAGNTLITHHSIMQNEAPQRSEESVRQDTQKHMHDHKAFGVTWLGEVEPLTKVCSKWLQRASGDAARKVRGTTERARRPR